MNDLCKAQRSSALALVFNQTRTFVLACVGVCTGRKCGVLFTTTGRGKEPTSGEGGRREDQPVTGWETYALSRLCRHLFAESGWVCTLMYTQRVPNSCLQRRDSRTYSECCARRGRGHQTPVVYIILAECPKKSAGFAQCLWLLLDWRDWLHRRRDP